MVSELSPGEKQAIRNWLDARWTNKICPACGQSNWIYSDNVIQLHVRDRTTNAPLVPNAPVYPNALVICAVCAHTLLFNTAIMGLEAPPPAKPPEGGA
jgi:hypothetical protein